MKPVVYVDMSDAPDVLIVETETEVLVNLAAVCAKQESPELPLSPQA